MFVQAGQILKAQLVGQGQHLGLSLGHLLESDLVDFLGGQVGGRHAFDLKAIALGAVGQRPYSRLGAAMRRIIVTHEGDETLVGRKNLAIDRGQHRRSQPLLISLGNAGRKFLQRLGKGAGVSLGVGDLLSLRHHFFQQVTGRHQPVFHSLTHVGGHLLEHPGDLMQSGEVVVVVLHAIERRQRHQFQKAEMRAVHLVDRHLPGLEAPACNVLAQVSDHQLAAQRILGRQSSRINGLEAGQKLAPGFFVGPIKLRRPVGKTIVVAVVPQRCCGFGVGSQLVLPFLVE